ncbi:MAG TPA: hypothetical protein VLJ58_20605 [Ramlibacter sp.]|nr:hypothetical protein [Ramlibacter sp.]
MIYSGLPLQRAFDVNLELCPNCGDERVISAAILVRPMIEKILKHLGLEPQPPRHRATVYPVT